jgi:uncharacterized peroxidase-related enzyme
VRLEGGSAELAEGIAARRWRDVPGLTAREQALCAVAEKLSATPTRMTEQDWRPLRSLGFDDTACLEVAHVVGLFNYLTRLADGFGLQPRESKAGFFARPDTGRSVEPVG